MFIRINVWPYLLDKHSLEISSFIDTSFHFLIHFLPKSIWILFSEFSKGFCPTFDTQTWKLFSNTSSTARYVHCDGLRQIDCSLCNVKTNDIAGG